MSAFTVSAQKVDTLKTQDSLKNFGVKKIDTVSLGVKKDTTKPKPLDRLVEYTVKDSLHLYMDSMIAYMYNGVDLKSKDMELKAGKVRVDITHNEIESYITYDSLGHIDEKPEFDNKEDKFVASYMKYNFKTRKGYARNVKTEQSEGFLHGSQVKIFPSGTTNILHGKFTTCNLDHPHYYIKLSKARYIPNKAIVTGPFYFVIEDIPIPIGLPFGYFPQRKYNTSGIIQPELYQEQERGIGLINGGYYFVLNDKMDLKVLADIFSKGSWGLKTRLRINDRYRYQATLSFNYTHRTTEERILLDSRKQNLYNFIFTFHQKPKANPTLNFSANVNFSMGKYEQYNAVNIQQFVKNTSNSSINLTKNFRGTPFRISVNASATQNFQDNTIDINAPHISFVMNRIQPFKKLFKPSSKSWFKDISIGLRANFENTLPHISDTTLFYHPDTLRYLMQDGLRYTIPINLKPIHLFHYINISPTFNYVGRVYFSYINKRMINDTTVEIDTIFRPRHIYEYNFGLNASTNLYGIFRVNAFGIKAIRHKLTPHIGFIYRPDFGNPKYGIYLPEPGDTTNTRFYSAFYRAPVGLPGRGLQKSINYGINNNFEMKIRKREGDTVVEKKVRLLDILSISGNYNFAADSLRFSPISINASTNLGRYTNFSFNAILDPYTIDKTGRRINVYEYTVSGKLLRLRSLTFHTTFNLSSQDFQNGEQKPQRGQKEPPAKQQYVPYKYFNPKWNFSIDYRFSLNSVFDNKTGRSVLRTSQILNTTFAMNPTPYWTVQLFTGFDFNKKTLVAPTIQIYRDLHCWEMLLQVTPTGRMKSYLFTVRIKSPMFSFFQFKRQRSWHDNFM